MKNRLLKSVFWVTSKLPLAILQLIGLIVGNLLYIIPNKAKKVAFINIDLCFSGHSKTYRRQLLRKSLVQMSNSLLELGPMWLWPKEKLLSQVKEVEGIEQLEACLANHRGLFAATPHLGAWELCGLFGSSRYQFTAMYRPPRVKALEPWIIRARERAGAKLVDYGRPGIKAMISALQQGEVVGILPDQEPRESGGVFAPFFGVPAYTMTLISKLARKTNAAVFFAYMQRLPRGKGYRLVIREAEPGIDSSDESTAATALNRSLEKCIMDCPEQYLWAYRRFKQRPPGTMAAY